MPPQIDNTLTLDQNSNIDKSLPDYNQRIFNIKKYLFVLLFIQWFVCIVTLAVGIYSIIIGNVEDISNGIKSLIPIIVFAIYYTFGLVVTYKEYRIGLLIFASIGVVLFIIVCILVGYIAFAIIALSVGFGNTRQVYEFTIFTGIFFAIIAIVAILTLKLSFDLAKLIKINEYSSV